MKVHRLMEELAELDPLTEVFVGSDDDSEPAIAVHVRPVLHHPAGGRLVLIEGAWDQ